MFWRKYGYEFYIHISIKGPNKTIEGWTHYWGAYINLVLREIRSFSFIHTIAKHFGERGRKRKRGNKG